MNVTEQEQKIVNELAAVMRKHRSLGALHLVECLRMAWEKEIGYGKPAKSKPGTTPVDGGKVTANDFAGTRRSRRAH